MKYNIDEAFPETPECVHEAIYLGMQRASARQRRVKRFTVFCSAAAALAVLVFGGIMAGRMTVDPVTSTVASESRMVTETMVFASKNDPYWHVNKDCAGGVELALITASAFGKTACPVCAGK